MANFRHDSSSLTHNTAKLQWDAVSPTPDKYRIESCSSSSAGCPDATLVTSPAGSATSHDLSSLTRNTAYYYRIKALAASNSDYSDSGWASILTVTTAKEPLAAISGFTSERIKPPNNQIKVRVSWNANSQTGLDKYELVECSDKNCSSTKATHLITETKHEFIAQRNTSYYFRVGQKRKQHPVTRTDRGPTSGQFRLGDRVRNDNGIGTRSTEANRPDSGPQSTAGRPRRPAAPAGWPAVSSPHRSLARFGGRCSHTHQQAART